MMLVNKEEINDVVKTMVGDLRNNYNITACGSDLYRVVITPRELSLFERFRVRRAEKLLEKCDE